MGCVFRVLTVRIALTLISYLSKLDDEVFTGPDIRVTVGLAMSWG